MQINSPFDATVKASIIKKINVKEIIDAYRSEYNIDVSDNFENLAEIYICECSVTKLRFFYPFGLDGDVDFYRKLSENEWYYSADRWEHEEIIKYVDNKDSVLEIGSGDGIFLKNLTAKKEVSYVGLELNIRAIEKAKKEISN